MATRKMTFTLPEELAVQFARRVPPRRRSHYLAEALAQKLAERDREILRACEIANSDPEVEAIEREFDALPGKIEEPWAEVQPRPKARRGVVGASRSRPRLRD
jgi:hypothetical protein